MFSVRYDLNFSILEELRPSKRCTETEGASHYLLLNLALEYLIPFLTFIHHMIFYILDVF
jgi:hypothetical protein